jgi:hypothetical protein
MPFRESLIVNRESLIVSRRFGTLIVNHVPKVRDVNRESLIVNRESCPEGSGR